MGNDDAGLRMGNAVSRCPARLEPVYAAAGGGYRSVVVTVAADGARRGATGWGAANGAAADGATEAAVSTGPRKNASAMASTSAPDASDKGARSNDRSPAAEAAE